MKTEEILKILSYTATGAAWGVAIGLAGGAMNAGGFLKAETENKMETLKQCMSWQHGINKEACNTLTDPTIEGMAAKVSFFSTPIIMGAAGAGIGLIRGYQKVLQEREDEQNILKIA